MSEYTPGPWQSDLDDSAIVTEDMTLARVYWAEGRAELENRANARLMAAAPAMLEALAGMWCSNCLHHVGEPSRVPHPLTCPKCRAARGALAQARGEAQP